MPFSKIAEDGVKDGMFVGSMWGKRAANKVTNFIGTLELVPPIKFAVYCALTAAFTILDYLPEILATAGAITLGAIAAAPAAVYFGYKAYKAHNERNAEAAAAAPVINNGNAAGVNVNAAAAEQRQDLERDRANSCSTVSTDLDTDEEIDIMNRASGMTGESPKAEIKPRKIDELQKPDLTKSR